jgi:hypothetical protein
VRREPEGSLDRWDSRGRWACKDFRVEMESTDLKDLWALKDWTE